MCDSGVLNYTTRAVLIADLRPTNKQYSAQSRVPCWGRLGTVRCRASHLIVTGPRYHQLTTVTSTKGRDLTLHESFSSPGDSDTAYNETTILEPDSESEVCRLHSTVLDPVGSDDPDQSRQEMSIRHSLKEAPKDPAVVQVLTNAITSSLRGENLERKEEKIAELQDRGVDSLEQYSRRNNVFRSAYPWEHHRCREHRCHRPKGWWGDRRDDHWRDDWSVTPSSRARWEEMSSSNLHLTGISTSSWERAGALSCRCCLLPVSCRCRQAAGFSSCRGGYAGSLTSGQGLR